MTVIHIEDYDSIQKEVKRLEKMKNAPRYMAPVMNKILVDMARATGELIKSEGRRGGGSFKRLKPETIKKKGNKRILYTSGSSEGYSTLGGSALVHSVTYKTGGRFAVREHDQRSVTFGTTHPYADVHQEGGGRNIPARPFILFTEYDINRWKRWMLAHLVASHTNRSSAQVRNMGGPE
jgi:phage gpG-like protein